MIAQQTALQQISEALNFLAGRCDGARTEDSIGFNGTDSAFGKSLAQISLNPKGLSSNQSGLALKMLRKYEKTQLNPNGFYLPTEIELAKVNKQITINPVLVVKEPETTSTVDIKDEKILVLFEYSRHLYEVVSGIRPKGVFVNDDAIGKHWVFDINFLETVLQTLIAEGFTLTETVKQRVIQIEEERKAREAEIVYRLENCIDFLKRDCVNWKYQPFDHQWKAVEFLVSTNTGILADQMGLGKTHSALITAKALQNYYCYDGDEVAVYVLSPVSLKLNWIKEAKNINLQIEVFSHAKIPQPPKNKKYIVIVDECHNFQNITAQRTKAFLTLTENEKCLHLYCLSGTPMKNGRPSNLYPILKACKHPIAFNRKEYEKRYCDAHATHFTKWDVSGATNLEELSDEISDILIRRTKEECLNLPPKIITPIECESTEELEKRYQEDLNDLKMEYQRRVEERLISDKGQAIVFLGYLRRMSSQYKIQETINMANDLLAQDESVVIFTEFKGTAKFIAEYFGVEPLTGETKLEARQQMVDDFQTGINKVFVGTIKAGGVGITLTKASYNLIMDFPWTPGDLEQCEDRCHRIGSTRTVNIYNLYAKEIDYIMAAIIGQKNENISKVLSTRGIDVERKKDSQFFADLLENLLGE